MSHTPAPWSVGGHEPNCVFAGEEYQLIAECHSRKSGNYDRTEPEQVANAKLCAAAPDLLAACQAVMRTVPIYSEAFEMMYDPHSLGSLAEQLRAAIAKATP